MVDGLFSGILEWSFILCVVDVSWSVLCCVWVTDVEKDSSLRMSSTVDKIKQLMTDLRSARTCQSLHVCVLCHCCRLYTDHWHLSFHPVCTNGNTNYWHSFSLQFSLSLLVWVWSITHKKNLYCNYGNLCMCPYGLQLAESKAVIRIAIQLQFDYDESLSQKALQPIRRHLEAVT